MKILISADIEGVAGASHWDETDKKQPDYAEFREQMTAEVNAACEGAKHAGVAEIWIKDAHATARNLIFSKLPKDVRLVRGWSGHPFAMVQELDSGFQALMMIGYHAAAGSGANPLAHTISGSISQMLMNGKPVSEFWIHAHAAGLKKVPVVFLSGDSGVCTEAQGVVPGIKTVSVKEGTGGSVCSIHPDLAVEQIRNQVEAAMVGDLSKCKVVMPDRFQVEITYKEHPKAYRLSYYPGAKLKDPHTIRFETQDYFEVLRFLMFVI